MKYKRKKRDTEIPTSSMADIAFLLIIFFMLSTTFSVNKGFDFGIPPKEQEATTESESRPALTLIVDNLNDPDRNYIVKVMDEQGNIEEYYSDSYAEAMGQPQRAIVGLSDFMNQVFEDVRLQQPGEWYKLPVYILVRRNAPWEGFVDVWEEVQEVEREQITHFPDIVERDKRKLATHIPHVNTVRDIIQQYREQGIVID
ncbi:MAG TPA: biopolymer transporter ExbD [Acidobacteriota bacterium]|nr:biopolymer transporter ExbD [Acidobacteriota bacterium]